MPDTAAATLPPDPSQQYIPGAPDPLYGAVLPTRPVTAPPAPAGQPQSLLPQPQYGGTFPTLRATPSSSAASGSTATAPTGRGGDYTPWSTEQMADYIGQNNATAFTPDQAHGVARALHDAESKGGNPFSYNPAGGGAGAYGEGQWRGTRQRELVTLYGATPTVPNQLDYLAREFLTRESAALKAVKSARTEQEAYDAMEKYYERPGPPKGLMQAGASPDYQNIVTRSDKIAKDERAEIQRLTTEADKADPDSQLRHQRLQQAMDHSERLMQNFEYQSQHPPTETPLDMMQNFGSLATVIALAGGLFAKRPLTAALNAAGSAMRAQQEGNHEQARRAYQVWQDQTELISKALSFQNQEINQIMEDRRLSEAERRDKIEEHLRLNGMQLALDQWNIGNYADVMKLIAAQPKLIQETQLNAARIKEANARADYYERGGAGGKPAHFGSLNDLMERWHLKFVKDNNREPTLDETAKASRELKGEATPPGQTAQNIAERIMIGANDVSKTLDALTALPGGTTLGMLGGAQAALGRDMADNFRKALANRATPESSQVLRALTNGASRALAALQNAGSVQGAQMMSEQLKADFAEANDTGLTQAAKMADVRQISEAALEILATDSRLNDEQRAKINQVLSQIQTAVPFTTRDVALLVDRGNPERFREFAEKLGLGKVPEGVPEGSKKLNRTKDGHPVWQGPDGSIYVVN